MELFSALLALCVGNSSVIGGFPSQKPVTRSFGIFFDLRLNKRLSKQSSRGELRRHLAHFDVTVMAVVTKFGPRICAVPKSHTIWVRVIMGWGLLSQFLPFPYFPSFPALSKPWLPVEYHVNNWQLIGLEKIQLIQKIEKEWCHTWIMVRFTLQ